MNILISSKYLSSVLKKINFNEDNVQYILGGSYEISFVTTVKTIDVSCIIISDFTPRIKQAERRWDWIKKLVSNVNDQPIVLNISENNVKVSFDY